MLKKLISLMGILFITATSVFADSDVNIQTVEFNPFDVALSVSGNSPTAKSKQYVLTEIINKDGDVIAAEQGEMDKTAFAVKNYLLPEDLDTGYYDVRVSVEGKSEAVKENAFYYCGKEKAVELLNSINGETSVSALDSIIMNNYESLAFAYIDTYKQCASKSMMLENVMNEDLAADNSNVNTKWKLFLEILSKDTLLTYFSDTKSAADIKSMIEDKLSMEVMGFNLDSDELYNSLNNDGINELYSLVAADSVDDLSKSFNMLRENIFVAALRTGRYTDAEKAFKYIDDVVSVSYADYNSLSEAKKNDVMKAVAEYAKNADISAIIEKFESTAKSARSSGSSSSSSGGSSSSSSSSSSSLPIGGYVYIPEETKTENTTTATVQFTDISEAEWAREAILALANKGVVSGMGNGLFEPNGYVTRAQFCQMVSVCFGIEATGNSPFKDVADDVWYAKAVTALAEAGIIAGVGDGYFAPESKIKRQDIAVILYKIIIKYNFEVPQYIEPAKFTDDELISEYAYEAIYKLCGWGVLSGYEGYMSPLDNATRAQAASLIYRIEVAR